MNRRSFLARVLGGVAAVCVAARISTPKSAKPTPPATIVDSSGTWGGIKRGDYPALNSPTEYVLLMSPAQLKAYRELGYNIE